MKKIIFGFLSVIILSGSAITLAQNEQITQYFDGLGGGDLFGYSGDQQINVQSISEDSITFSSPIIKNENDEKVVQYNVLFSENLLSEVINNADLIDTLHEKNITISEEKDFNFTVDKNSDQLDENKTYYLSVAPKDESGIIGAVSDEYCFNIKEQVYSKVNEDKDACLNKIAEKIERENTPVHNAAGADMSLANITHTIDGNSIILTWIAIEGSDTIEIFLLNENETKDGEPLRESLGNVDMMEGKFIFPYQGDHSTSILFKPDNGGKEYVYTLNFTPPVEKVEPEPIPEPKPEIKVVPQTGTKENFLVILIITILGFVLYKAMRKSR